MKLIRSGASCGPDICGKYVFILNGQGLSVSPPIRPLAARHPIPFVHSRDATGPPDPQPGPIVGRQTCKGPQRNRPQKTTVHDESVKG